MDISAIRAEVQLKLTGGILELELNEDTLNKIINASLREIQRYICSTKIITIPFERCIQMNKYDKVSSVSRVYRASYIGSTDSISSTDPMYVAQWQLLGGGGNIQNYQNYMYDYMAWNTMSQIRNTTSTDLIFRYDKSTSNLYINIASNQPDVITVEYVPDYQDVSDITSDYWIDVLVRYSVATAKILVGRIRSRYTQSNALWTNDGAQLLEEGTAELNLLRETMERNSQLVYPID